MYTANKVEDENVKARLPEPSGYRLLIAIPEVSEKTEGGVYMPDQLKKAEETASLIGFVVKVGPEAYADANKFPSGPWCKEGDFVIFRSYSGRECCNRQHVRWSYWRSLDQWSSC